VKLSPFRNIFSHRFSTSLEERRGKKNIKIEATSWARGAAHWESTCLAYTRPYV
jgi:hypothetical protein